MTPAPSHAHHPHHGQLLDTQGNWLFTNRLVDQTSPYLRQHAHNPVDWYPWGQEAFAQAQSRNRPIFLSIGYATCYWCHVMERLVFENPAIAAVMNEGFVNIKVDREQRPDLDDLYMMATQLLTRHGGWPMSVFLTPPGARGAEDPGLEPFYAGTYFPPEPGHGLPSFVQLLAGIDQAWREQRPAVLEQAASVTEALRASLVGQVGQRLPDRSLPSQVGRVLMQMMDRRFGGFGDKPKFPTPVHLRLLLALEQREHDPDRAAMIALTLTRMARGGIYDQLGGGFHRYSVDEQWLVPHFEKMLYDQAQLITLYTLAQQCGCGQDVDGLYLQVVQESSAYVLREMVDPCGAFWSAQDAEVDGREGANYLWSPQEIEQALADDDLALLALDYYGLTRGPNFQDPHDRHAPPANVLFVPEPDDRFADRHGLTLAAWQAKRQTIRTRLLAARQQRRQPITDDKMLVQWSGMMIAALARAAALLEDAVLLDAAIRAARAIEQHLSDGVILHRTLPAQDVSIPGFLGDYAELVDGLLALHEVDGHAHWLERAVHWTQRAIEQFADGQGGYFDTRADADDLIVRGRSLHDGALPAPVSVMLHNLLSLYERTGEALWAGRIRLDLKALGQTLTEHAAQLSWMQVALLRAEDLGLLAPPGQQAGPDMRLEVVARQLLDADQERVLLRWHVPTGHHVAAIGPGAAAVTVRVASGVCEDWQVHWPSPQPRAMAGVTDQAPGHAGVVDLLLSVRGARGRGVQVGLTAALCDARQCLPATTCTAFAPVRVQQDPAS